MKRGLILGLFLLSFMIIGVLGAVGAQNAGDPQITVISPNGGEAFNYPDTYEVSWTSDNSVLGDSNMVRIIIINYSSGEHVQTFDNVPSPDGITNVYTVTPRRGMSGEYTVHVEYTNATECPKTVVCHNDDSDRYFSIVGDSLEGGSSDGSTMDSTCTKDSTRDSCIEERYRTVEGLPDTRLEEADSLRDVLRGNLSYEYSKWMCQNEEIGSSEGDTSCKSSEKWYSYAEEFCQDKCNDAGVCGVMRFSVGGECSDSKEGTATSGGGSSSGGDARSGGGSSDEVTICKSSCSFGDSCLPIGTRAEGKYCDIKGELVQQLEAGEQCDNSFECGSNVCVNNQCVDSGLIQRILNWFRKFFGGE